MEKIQLALKISLRQVFRLQRCRKTACMVTPHLVVAWYMIWQLDLEKGLHLCVDLNARSITVVSGPWQENLRDAPCRVWLQLVWAADLLAFSSPLLKPVLH